MGSTRNSKERLLYSHISLCIVFALISSTFSSKLYVVYMGSIKSDSPDETLRQHHHMLSIVHKGSLEKAMASHVYSYRHGFNGFAAKLSQEQVSQMAEMEGVVSVFPNTRRTLHTTHSWDFMELMNEENMEIPGHSKKNQFNVIVGFLDSGIWPESASFSDANMPPVPVEWKGQCEEGESFNSSMCNRKVIGARYYLSGYQLEEESENTKSFRSPRDSVGHGSHTASTAAGRFVSNVTYKGMGSGGARGGAPTARISVYKTCWGTEGACYDVDILAAFDDAIRDGVHVLSISLGPNMPQGDYFSDGISVGSFHAVSHGIVVVASVGNAGSSGYASNAAPWIITVAAGSVDRDFTSDIILGNRTHFSGESLSVLEMKASTRIISASEAYAENFLPIQSSYCLGSSLDPTKTKDKVLVCQDVGFGNSIKWELAKGTAVKEAGGVGMILINEAYKDIAIPFTIPAAIVGKKTGDEILSYVNNTRNPTSEILSAKTVFNSKPAPRVAFFSSRGPNAKTPEILKPDIMAPGVNILAAWSPLMANMKFNIQSGTSMACPHITGIVAYIKAFYPSWSPSAIKSAIMTTATTLDKNGKPITSDPDRRKANPFDFGSGFVSPTKVLDPGLIYDSTPNDYKDFLCSIGYSESTVQQITGDNSTCKNIAFQSASSLNYPSITVPNLKKSFTVSRTVTNVGRPRSIYEVVVLPPIGINVTVLPKRLVFSRYGEKRTYTVKFEVNGPVEGYVFGSLSWRNGESLVTTPLVVRSLHNKIGSKI